MTTTATRRSFLARATAALAGGAAASLAPVAPAQAAPAENPDLIALSEQMDSALAAFHAAATRKAAARAMAERLCPPVPDEIVENDPLGSGFYTAQEVDVEGEVVHPYVVRDDGRTVTLRSRRIMNSELAKRAVKQGNMYAPKRTKAGRALWAKIAIAEQYEAERAQALLAFADVDGISSSYPGKAGLMLGRRLAELMVKVGAGGAPWRC